MYDMNLLKEKRYTTVSIECYNLCEKHIRKNISATSFMKYVLYIMFHKTLYISIPI